MQMTDPQEAELVDWVKAHELLYNKGLRDYKDSKRKQRRGDEKGVEMDIEGDDLKVWYESMHEDQAGEADDHEVGRGSQGEDTAGLLDPGDL